MTPKTKPIRHTEAHLTCPTCGRTFYATTRSQTIVNAERARIHAKACARRAI